MFTGIIGRDLINPVSTEPIRAKLGIPDLPLTRAQIVEYFQRVVAGDQNAVSVLENRVKPGAYPESEFKAEQLFRRASGGFLQELGSLITPKKAVEMLNEMRCGYNVSQLIKLLSVFPQDSTSIADLAAEGLKNQYFIYRFQFDAVADLINSGRKPHTRQLAQQVLTSWAQAEWFKRREAMPEKIEVVILRVKGTLTTDDLSHADGSWSRDDIPLHAATSSLKTVFPAADDAETLTLPNGKEVQKGEIATAVKTLSERTGRPVMLTADVIGTGSSRKSGENSTTWFTGKDIPGVPNRRNKQITMGGHVAPIYFNTVEDSGGFPIEGDVSALGTGMVVTIRPYEGRILDEFGQEVSNFTPKPASIFDEWQAGGRLPLIAGQLLTSMACTYLNVAQPTGVFTSVPLPERPAAMTAWQKVMAKEANVPFVVPGQRVLVQTDVVGSQDTTGVMTEDEAKEMGSLGFDPSVKFIQSFCHYAGDPKEADFLREQSLGNFVQNYGGIAFRMAAGIVHTLVNRMLRADKVGTGGDSHTRFPLGISFPAGSGLVAFAGAYGQMPVDIPESAYVEIDGELPEWADWRDVVNFINYRLKQEGRLVIKQVSRGKKKMEKSALSGKFLQIRYKGKSVFGIEEAWQIADKSAEQHVGGCYVILSPEAKLDWLKHERRWLQHQLDKKLARGEEAMRIAIEGLDADIAAIEANPEAFVFEDDTNIPAEQLHSEVVRIDLSQMSEPVLALPWEPQDAVLLSEVSGTEVDEVFIGSCMMDMQQIRAAAVIMEANPTLNVDTLKVVAPSIEEFNQLEVEGVMNILRACGAVIGLPGCHECMGNLPKVRLTEGCTGFSTGTRNFLNRMGKNTTVYEGSAWMAACVAILGRIPTFEEYLTMVQPALSKLVSIRQKMRFTDMMDEQLDQLTAIPA